MYDTHQPVIEAFARQNPENTARVIKFVLLTIQRQLELVEPLMDNPQRRVAKITKRGIAYAEQFAYELHSIIFDANMADEDKLLHVLQVPGLGIVKAAFVLQLCGQSTRLGCLDTHNIRMYGLDEKAFRSSGVSVTALNRRIRLYADICDELGGPRTLWDNWCDYVAGLRPKKWPTGEHVSRAHVDFILN